MACYSPYYVESPKAAALGHPRGIPVPCGKCPNCKRRRVTEWAFRLRNEDLHSPAAFFLTLTYYEAPMTPNRFMTLNPYDLSCFWKRLRKAGYRFKYYAVGEYGTLHKRPHYHAIVFMEDEITESMFSSVIDKYWGWGAIHVGTVSGASVAYTLKYIDKPTRIPEHSNDDRIPEFSRSSQGLGKNYVTDDIKDYYNANPDKLYLIQDGYKVPMSRYYQNLLLDDQAKAIYRRNAKQANEDAVQTFREHLDSVGDHRDINVVIAEARLTDDQNFYKSQKPRDI